MSKKEDDQEMSMEEILASIRRYVSGDPVDAPPDNLKGRNKDVYSNYQQARSSDSNQRYANQPSFEPSERVSQANYDRASHYGRSSSMSPEAPEREGKNEDYPQIRPDSHARFEGSKEYRNPGSERHPRDFVQEGYNEPRTQAHNEVLRLMPEQEIHDHSYEKANQRSSGRQEQEYGHGKHNSPPLYSSSSPHRSPPSLQRFGERDENRHAQEEYESRKFLDRQYEENDHPYEAQSKKYREEPPSLVNEAVIQASSQKIAELSQQFSNQKDSSLSVEGFVKDLVTPMAKEWLNKHLYGIVERIVRQEVDRITKS